MIDVQRGRSDLITRNSHIMALRRTLMNCRLKTRVAIFGFGVLLVSSLLMFHVLTSDASKHQHTYSSMPTLEQRRPLRLKHKDSNIPVVKNLNNSFQILKEQSHYETELAALGDRDLLSAESKEALHQFLGQLYPTNWANAPETDEVALDLKYLLIDYGLESKLTCKEIDSLRLGTPISLSRTKYIEYGYSAGEDESSYHYDHNVMGRSGAEEKQLAIRSPANDMETKVACMKQIYDANLCSAMGNYRVLREIVLLSCLDHPNILLMKGYCLRGNRIASRLQEKGLVVITEVGTPFTHSTVALTSPYHRVFMALQVVRLLLYLDKSPVGSLRFRKLDMKDFILTTGQVIKLADLDDLDLGEKSCRDDAHCTMEGNQKGVACKHGFCEGLNSMINLDLAVKSILYPLLHFVTSDKQLDELLIKLESLQLSTVEVMARLQMIHTNSSPDSPQNVQSQFDPDQNNRADHHNDLDNRADHHNDQDSGLMKMNVDREDNAVKVLSKEANRPPADVISNFLRRDQMNYAGIYDYPCAGSRVSWGCVFTVTSLTEAATICLSDPACRCFVTFTTQPETERLMTVVMKNASEAQPHSSLGTTLFIKQSGNSSPGKEMAVDADRLDRDLSDHDTGQRAERVAKSSTEVHDCMEHTLQVQEAARYSREKRLMAHLGLKGIREQAWRRSALRQNLEFPSRITRVEGGGGKFVANLSKRFADDPEEKASKVLFLSEDGPYAYHMAYALVYHLDRLLGLYHTPPCVAKQLSPDTVQRYHGNSNWVETFGSLIESDGTLPGVMAVPTPKVMKVSKLTLEPLEVMTSEIVAFERADKLQLEYVLLWWLARMDKGKNEHLGYKGHLIHFYADKGFTDTDISLAGYLYHCQFPNVVYKSLSCQRCQTSDGKSRQHPSICSLGEEVLTRTKSMFPDAVDLSVQNLKETQIISTINTAASDVLQVVDACIKRFGRENVLY